MNLVDKAEAVARKAHEGQYRDKGKFPESHPYIAHPLAVKAFVEKFGGNEEDQAVALLHDVVEDCSEKGFDMAFIAREFGARIAARVDELTNKKVDPDTHRPLPCEEWKRRKGQIQARKARDMGAGNQLVKACDQLCNIVDTICIEPEKESLKSVLKREKYIGKATMVVNACAKLPKEAAAYFEIVKNKAVFFLEKEKDLFGAESFNLYRNNFKSKYGASL